MTKPSPTTAVPRMPCNTLRPGDSVDSSYLLASLEMRAKKNGDPYFFMTLADATGSVQGVMWENHADFVAGLIRAEDYIRVEGHTADYKGNLQLTVRRVEAIQEGQIDYSEFVAVSPRPREEMERELDGLIARVGNPECKRLLERFFTHARFRELFCTAPAAARIHQAYIGGLLEHTLNVMKNALQMAPQYEPVDYDLLITGGLLHDIGKIREFDWKRAITYSDEGRLLGHITIGASMVDSAIRQMQRDPASSFPEHYRLHILHLILSHHGKLEYGSPILPKSREALLLHYADYADAYLTSFANAVTEARHRGEPWTPYNKMFESYLYAGAGEPAEDGDRGMPPSAAEQEAGDSSSSETP
ncbi:MAG: 3-5 exoribonuclease [Candidatus Sumerlaeota bacterium]|nr:3-5 exoribonuclease [Candidatus Sumerlaeota bacterium]